MGMLGRRRQRCGTTGRQAAALLMALAVVLTGCSGDNDSTPSGNDESSSASPSESPTPSVLEGGERVEGPVFSFLRHPDYTPAKNNPDEGDFGPGGWTRIYSDTHNFGLNVISVDYQRGSVESAVETIPLYLRSGAAKHIKRVDDARVMGTSAGHWTGRNENAIYHTYLLDLDDGYTLQINFERARQLPEHEQIQQAMLDSFHLTE